MLPWLHPGFGPPVPLELAQRCLPELGLTPGSKAGMPLWTKTLHADSHVTGLRCCLGRESKENAKT